MEIGNNKNENGSTLGSRNVACRAVSGEECGQKHFPSGLVGENVVFATIMTRCDRTILPLMFEPVIKFGVRKFKSIPNGKYITTRNLKQLDPYHPVPYHSGLVFERVRPARTTVLKMADQIRTAKHVGLCRSARGT
ncbi:hypothetical protein F2Q68_00026422 [Brassica cretica]|uniref:Uncharacterized protein n=1 Tax=Brassica cretica TaxID=69181 RepID=A0A8S9IIV5_BRACR|nr:hypothetical protein F2Q68_00026422 [Brassica cretica]